MARQQSVSVPAEEFGREKSHAIGGRFDEPQSYIIAWPIRAHGFAGAAHAIPRRRVKLGAAARALSEGCGKGLHVGYADCRTSGFFVQISRSVAIIVSSSYSGKASSRAINSFQAAPLILSNCLTACKSETRTYRPPQSRSRIAHKKLAS